MSEKENDDKLVLDATLKLREHFSSVRIFVTRDSDDGEPNSIMLTCGRGNYYAQLGAIQEWSAMQDEYHRNEARRRDAKGRTTDED